MSNPDNQSPGGSPEKFDLDNRSRQLNPLSDEYWQSRGYTARPKNWEALLAQGKASPKQGR